MLIKSLRKFTLTSLLIIFSLVYSCSSTKDMSRNQKKSGHFELYSYPKKIERIEDDDRYKRLVVLSLNDFNGQIEALSTELKGDLAKGKRYIQSGGITGLKAYLDIFREEYKEESILVDAGSFLNKNAEHKRTVFLYNYLGIDVANLGHNEFDLNTRYRNYTSYLDSLFKKANFKTINTNLYDLNKGAEARFRYTIPSYIKEVNGLKVAFIGLHSQDVAKKNTLTKLNGYYFQNMAKAIIEDANYLRKNGAQFIVVLAHNGIDCTSLLSHNLEISPMKVNFEPKDISGCESVENELIKTLSLLPPNMVDLVITSGKRSKVTNKFYKFPVMQNFGDGQYISFAELYYDTKHHRVASEMTRTYQPVQTCHRFLEDNDDCFVEEGDLSKEIEPAFFLGKKIKIQPLPNF